MPPATSTWTGLWCADLGGMAYLKHKLNFLREQGTFRSPYLLSLKFKFLSLFTWMESIQLKDLFSYTVFLNIQPDHAVQHHYCIHYKGVVTHCCWYVGFQGLIALHAECSLGHVGAAVQTQRDSCVHWVWRCFSSGVIPEKFQGILASYLKIHSQIQLTVNQQQTSLHAHKGKRPTPTDHTDWCAVSTTETGNRKKNNRWKLISLNDFFLQLPIALEPLQCQIQCISLNLALQIHVHIADLYGQLTAWQTVPTAGIQPDRSCAHMKQYDLD